MKELARIILTSWSPPPRTPQLQLAGLQYSVHPLYRYMCVGVGGWVNGVWSHLHVNDASPTWMLIIFLIGFLDMVTSARDCKAASLCSCFSAIVLFSWFGCVYACVCACVWSGRECGLEALRPLTSNHPLVFHFHHHPSSALTLFTHLSNLFCALANTFETSTTQTRIETL